MVSVYKFLVKLLLLVLNLMFVMQIILLGLVFFSTSYWFFDLIGSQVFAFAEPLASSIIDFMHLFYQHDIEVGGVYIDGSLLLFGMISLVLVFVVAKLKGYIYEAIDFVDTTRIKLEQRIEEKFNKQLQSDVEKKVLKNDKCAILVELHVKSLQIELAMDNGLEQRIKEKEDEVVRSFYMSVKDFKGCQIARTEDKILIQFDEFDKVDSFLNFIDITLKKLRTDLRAQRWLMHTFISVETFENKQEFKDVVYPFLCKLVSLKCKNEMVSTSSFCMRYKLSKTQTYMPLLKGSYDINGKTDVWVLVKKD